MKDHYATLGLTPAATKEEIKLAFRRLAIKYHPDKNGGDAIAEAAFKEVKEAYDVLSNAGKKQQYLAASQFEKIFKHQQPVADAAYILKQTVHLKQLVVGMDPHRVNREALLFKIDSLLSAAYLDVIKNHAEKNLQKQFISTMLYCFRPLHYNYIKQLTPLLLDVAGTNKESLVKIHAFETYKKREALWSRYKLFIAVILTLLLCFIIYEISVNY